jgi:tRNA G18 (ribose-2'-O)-methylase SpoU
MQIAVIAHNIRSVHNVGSILRTAEGLGISKVFMTGYTPYPIQPNDDRPPHVRNKLMAQLHKTALGAETMPTEYREDPQALLAELRGQGYELAALEQNQHSVDLQTYQPEAKRLALLLGEEVHGITPDLLKMCDVILEIPMRGKKESFNVSVAAGISMYVLSR